MKDLRIVFMGTPEFAVGTLKTLVENNYKVVGAVTAPDKPSGRGRQLKQSDVKEYAIKQDIKVLQPINLKDKSFIDELKALNANLQIVVAFRMLPEVVWKMPEFGTFNLHASLLPNYRGAAPINWAIINGETKTGVTTFFIDEKIDTGKIIIQEEVGIHEADTAGTLHDKLMEMGSELVLKTVKLIENNEVHTTIQKNLEDLKPANKIHKETCRINWNNPINNIYNFVRGLNPYPTAWTLLQNNGEEINVKIYLVAKEEASHNIKPGMLVIDKSKIKVAAKNGFLELLEIQFPGKRKMGAKDVLNGYKFKSGAKML